MMSEISVKTAKRDEFIDITSKIQKIVDASKIDNGVCIVFCPHTTAAITINENADPDVITDILDSLNRQIPWKNSYKHSEGNSAAHVKNSLIGCSETIIINNGKLVLGTWQSVFFCEFDGPRQRKAIVKIIREE